MYPNWHITMKRRKTISIVSKTRKKLGNVHTLTFKNFWVSKVCCVELPISFSFYVLGTKMYEHKKHWNVLAFFRTFQVHFSGLEKALLFSLNQQQIQITRNNSNGSVVNKHSNFINNKILCNQWHILWSKTVIYWFEKNYGKIWTT